MMSGVVVKEEVTSEVEDENDEETKKRGRKKRLAEYARKRRELVRRVCAGEDVEGVGEEERRKIMEAEETRKKKNRERVVTDERRKAKLEYERKRMERKRRIAAGEEVDGVVGEEERQRITEAVEWRKRNNREKKREREAARAKLVEKLKSGIGGAEVDGLGEEDKLRIIEDHERRKEAKRVGLRFYNAMRRVTMTEEEREERRRKNYFGTQARLAKMSKEEREEKRRRFNERQKERVQRLDEEKRRKHFEGMKRSTRKYTAKLKERDPEGYRERFRKYQREQMERMDGEEKRRRLNQMKMYQQKRRLRKELEGMGESKEEIERRVEELDKKLRDELGIGPPKRRTRFGRKQGGDKEDEKEASYSKSVDCSERLVNLKEDVEAPSPSPIAAVSPAVPDFPEEENEFCEFDDEPVGIPFPESPPPPPSPPPIPKVAEVTFPCKYCKSPPFPTEEDLKGHLRAEHLKICWKCPKCKEVVLSGKHLSQHFNDKHNKRPEEEKSSLSTAQKAGSAILAQNITEDNCEEKGGAGDKKSTKVEFFCLRCPWQPETSSKKNKVFKSWRELQSHVKLKHRKYYWPCEFCHLLKYSKQSLIVHLLLCRKMPKDKS